MSTDPFDVRKHTDWVKVLGIIGTLAGGGWFVTEKVFAVGKTAASVAKIDSIEQQVGSQEARIIRTEYEAAGANAAVQRVEAKVDKQDGKLDRINEVLQQIRITGRR